MCFTPKLSASFSVAGIVATYLSYNIPELRKRYLHIIIAFYTCMEILQTLQFYTINNCSNKFNIILTNVAFVLVIVQPLLWNTIAYFLVNTEYEKGILMLGILLCILWILCYIFGRIYYYIEGPTPCSKCVTFNEDGNTCTKKEKGRHLYWTWSSSYLYGLNANYFMYFAIWFIPLLLAPSVRSIAIKLIFTAIIGVLITWKINGTMIEFASTWCFISIPFLLITFIYSIILTFKIK